MADRQFLPFLNALLLRWVLQRRRRPGDGRATGPDQAPSAGPPTAASRPVPAQGPGETQQAEATA